MNKYSLVTFSFLILSIFSNTANANVIIDERLELVSTVCRLANVDNMQESKDYPEYALRIDKLFAKHAKHKAVKSARMLSDIGFGKSEVVNLSQIITIENGIVQLSPDFTMYDELEAKYGASNIKNFVKDLNEFYTDTKFSIFYQSNSKYYNTLTDYFQKEILNKYTDTKCKKEFFTDNIKNECFILSPLVRQNNFILLEKKDGSSIFVAEFSASFARKESDKPVFFVPSIDEQAKHVKMCFYWGQYIDDIYRKISQKADKYFETYGDKKKFNTSKSFLLYSLSNTTFLICQGEYADLKTISDTELGLYNFLKSEYIHLNNTSDFLEKIAKYFNSMKL